jgi:hypothetical protein
MNVIPNAFKESNWEVMEGFYIRLSQAEPQYTWSGNLWLLRLPDTEDFRWFEVSYFEPLTSRPRMAPFGVKDKRDSRSHSRGVECPGNVATCLRSSSRRWR